jgi:hypothetical protein
MALESRIESLKRKHAFFDQRIHQEEGRIGADAGVIQRWKCEKLKLKDEIEQLLHGQRIAA